MTTALAEREKGTIALFRGLFERRKDKLTALLPAGLGVSGDRFVEILVSALILEPKLQECDEKSVIAAAYTAAKLGLMPGMLNSAHFVPFYNSKTKRYECKVITGYGGLRDIAIRTGIVRNIEPRVVYRDDDFAVQYGTNPGIEHVPVLASERRTDADITGFYAVAHLVHGGTQFDYMAKAEVDAIRAISKASVPEDTPMAWEQLECSAMAASHSLTFGPRMKYCDSSTSITALSISDLMARYWAFRSSIGIFIS